MDFKDRATSILKQKGQLDSDYLKNRGTIKPMPVEMEEEESKSEGKKTIPFNFDQNKIKPKLEEEVADEREYSVYDDPSLMNSPKSMQSAVSINHERKHHTFNVKKMIELIEGCCTNPPKQVEYIVELFKGVDFILNHENYWIEIFKSNLSRDMDYFLYNSLMLIENQEQMRTSLLSLIANMAVINYPEDESFGFKCLKVLKELINNDNPNIKNLVIGTLKNVIVPLIKKQDLMKISFNIMNGVNLILTNSFNKESSLFEPDLMNYGAMWIQQIKRGIIGIKDSEALIMYFEKYKNHVYHDAILNFLANLTIKKEFAESLVQSNSFQLELLTQLFEHFASWKAFKYDEENRDCHYKFRDPLLKRTNCVLQLLINVAQFYSSQIAPNDEKAKKTKLHLQDFVKLCLEKRHIEPMLRELLGHSDGYYSGYTIKEYEDEPMERIFMLRIYYQNLSQLITVYAKYFRFKEINELEFREEAVYKQCGYQVLSLLNYPKLDPLILKACAIFLANLLKHPNVEFAIDTKIHSTIQNTLMDYIPLMWFLGGTNYETLCWMGTLYHKPFINMDSEFEYCDVCDQRSPQIQEAFFHIIRVIKILSTAKNQNTRGTKTAQYCSDLCQRSSFTKERNSVLFKALEMPNDNVRLLICRTFSCLHPSIWQMDDLRSFLEILREMKSFTKSNCDEMIAEIFLIFSKILMFYTPNPSLESVLAEVIDICFEILLNNMERNFKDLHELNNRKIQISVSCIFFLRRASVINDLHNYFLTPKILFLTKKFFYFEEKYMQEYLTPMLLEDTWACSNIEHLLQSTAGNEQIQANTLLGFRLISRMADILQDQISYENDEDVDILEKDFTEDEEKTEEELETFHQWFQPKSSVYVMRIRSHFEKKFINKVKNELSTWKQIKKTGFMALVGGAIKNAKKDNYAKHPELYEENMAFNGQQIIYRLAMFVLMKEKNFTNKNEYSNKTSLYQKIEEFKDIHNRDKLAKEKPNFYEEMNLKNPLDFDPKRLRGKELLEIVLQGTANAYENELLALYRNQFFDVQNRLFVENMSGKSETFSIKNKSESPLKKRIAYDLNDSYNSLDKSNLSQMKDKTVSVIRPGLERNPFDKINVINKNGVEKLIENLNNKPYEDIIIENFATGSSVNLNRNTILLSALFRAMYFANKKSKISEEDTIKYQVNSINILRGLTKLANDIGWINSNIGYKYLRAIKFYYIMPESSAAQDTQMLHIYEIVFKSVNRMLKDIKNNCLDVNEKELLKMELMLLISEITRCVKVSLEQLRTIDWVKTSENEPLEKRHKTAREKKFQEKCMEFVITTLFPLKNFRIIVKIMLIYYKIFNDYSLIDQYDERAIKIKNKIISDFQRVIAAYVTICDEDKYRILSMFSEYENLLHEPIRQSFLNDILDESDKFQLMLGLERFMNKANLFFGKDKERIMLISKCFFRTTKDLDDVETVFLATNKGMYILKLKFSNCTICPRYDFCKEGPSVIVRHLYEEIANILLLEGDQRLGFKLSDEKMPIYFVRFVKYGCKKLVEKLFEKKLQMIKVKDHMYEERMNFLSEFNRSDIKLSFWVQLSLEPNPKMLSKGLQLEWRPIFLTFSNDILIITENPKEYSFQPPRMCEGYDNYRRFLKGKKKKLEENITDDFPTRKLVKPKSKRELLEVFAKFPVKESLSKIIFENNGENMVYLQFDKDVLSLKFFCDDSREKFKQEILQDLAFEEWKRSFKNMNLAFNRKGRKASTIMKPNTKETKVEKKKESIRSNSEVPSASGKSYMMKSSSKAILKSKFQ